MKVIVLVVWFGAYTGEPPKVMIAPNLEWCEEIRDTIREKHRQMNWPLPLVGCTQLNMDDWLKNGMPEVPS